ncbi:putative bifunctional diguanylate cyclase/phosphodiesterase [Marinobacter mobilis]|uniref:cyclic-guanylate-specific phosphodiesterase n=1 Tax=Marinobacter mobilis TaxID=488533 RepID=A0A1H2Z620_9GAMM|nr:EAL domain-containing protein [Marinobacter mobilis]SDX12882.1 diguanylate cyclase (GGDEF) domain-containing protein [Marinobacter mobilis]
MRGPWSSIQSKLVFLIAGISMVTVLVGFSLVTERFAQSLRDSLENDSLSLAQRLVVDSAAYLSLGMAGQARDNLLDKVVLNSPHSLALFDEQGGLFAEIERGGGQIVVDDYRPESAVIWESDWLHIYQPVEDSLDQRIGTLYLKISLSQLSHRMRAFVGVLLVLLLVMLALAYFLARLMQRYISGPILTLADISRQVRDHQNYSLRAPVKSSDEIGVLSQTFNDMLETIEQQQAFRDKVEQSLRIKEERLERAVAELQYMANYDSLTGLPNRALCMDRIELAIRHASRTRTYAGIIYLDLDHFKDVNDSLGHAVGDELLKATAERLSDVLREEDTLARIGGDEFVIITTDFSSSDQIIPLVSKVVERFEQNFTVGRYSVQSTVSLGVCVYPDDGDSVDALMKAADAAMYKAKDVGRNTYAFFEAEMNRMAVWRQQLGSELQHAIDRDELYLVFQPKVALESGQISGAEVLLRWEHPEFGSVSPADFIPVAEHTGLIYRIGLWVLEQACEAVSRWRDVGLEGVTVAVNLSAAQFRQADLVEHIAAILARHNVPPQTLELEITESMLVRDVDQAIRMLKRIKLLGLRVAIDDFGTGFSSLSYLRKFPLDALKIDRSFIMDLGKNRDDTAIALAIISMASSLRLKVVAEGVETPAQWSFLAGHLCDEVQGFLISPGLRESEFISFYKSFSLDEVIASRNV